MSRRWRKDLVFEKCSQREASRHLKRLCVFPAFSASPRLKCAQVLYRRDAENAEKAQRVLRMIQRTRRLRRNIITALLSCLLLFQTSLPVKACGPETIDPIFVFTNSPDIPFDNFVTGRIGVLQSTFGRKTLVIAHRYLNGGSFTAEEQRDLIEALKGKGPEDDDNSAIKAWIAARKEIVRDEEHPPAIYDERRVDGYDFFPNCSKNAFEVATQTLKDRVASYGSEDVNVRDWLDAQDVVFKNCAEGAEAPRAVSSGSPRWLEKDRDYQIAAAYFYSLNLNEARLRFEKIADDSESVWQEIAGYLVGRTLVKQASLTEDEKEKRARYERAEAYLINFIAHGGRFQSASKRLLSLVKFRLRPEERLKELSQILAEQSGNENLRQDLIDYNWLLDKFDAQVQKAESERKKQADPTPTPEPYKPDPVNQARYDAINRGELVELYFTPKRPDGEDDYTASILVDLKADSTEQDALQAVEIKLGRKLSSDESKTLKERYVSAMARRVWSLAPNRKVNSGHEYDGCDSNCNDLTLDVLPEFIRADNLSDWIMTFQSKDPKAYSHSVSKWRSTHSTAWLAVALTKSDKLSRGLARLMRDAEQIPADAPSFPTVAYHLSRLYLEVNRPAAAQKLLDKIITTQFESLPVSSQNLFLEQRIKLAGNVDEFLKFAMRKPAAFYEYGVVGRISDLLRVQKSLWDPEYYKETKEEYETKTEEQFKDFLPWDERRAFDPNSADLFNWHFSVASLLEAARKPELPDYLRRSLMISVWTRAILLKNYSVALEVSDELARLAPEMSSLLTSFQNAQTREQRESEALYTILKFPSLTPFVPSGVQRLASAEDSEYYFETSWWCTPDDTEYNLDGTESQKVVPSPKFLNPRIVAGAKKEREALSALGDAKSYLGKKVLEWALRSPDDPRIPEALYIGIQANQSYKYGCGSWEQDPETRTALETLLKGKYAHTVWVSKLEQEEK